MRVAFLGCFLRKAFFPVSDLGICSLHFSHATFVAAHQTGDGVPVTPGLGECTAVMGFSPRAVLGVGLSRPATSVRPSRVLASLETQLASLLSPGTPFNPQR